MAEIVFGIGTSHSPLLVLKPEDWDLRTQADIENPAHPFRGKTYTFDQLTELRSAEGLDAQNQPDMRQERYDRCQHQLDVLGDRIAEVDPDIMVVIGDDQKEWYQDDNQPALAVFHGDEVINIAFDPATLKGMAPGVAPSRAGYRPPEDHAYPVTSGLAQAIIEHAVGEEFDVTSSVTQPANENGLIGIGHAFGFVYRRILRDRPVPIVPIHINTYFPPNQPSAKRCFSFGQSIGRAIADWGNGERVAVTASGGLSHFVIDEEHDQRMLNALIDGDVEALVNEPENMFRSGTSETKNWITTAGILSATGMKMTLLDYVPCYRSKAGTGCAMAFATWS